MVPCCCCNYATVGHIGMQIFNFVVLSLIIALSTVLMYMKEKGMTLLRGGWKPNSPPQQSLKIY